LELSAYHAKLDFKEEKEKERQYKVPISGFDHKK
jgi:hypothetical protein